MIMKKYNISAEDFKVMETVILKSEPHKAGQQWYGRNQSNVELNNVEFFFLLIYIHSFQIKKEIYRCLLLCDNRSYNNWLRPFNAKHYWWQIIYHVLCYRWHSIGARDVSEYRRKS